MIQRNAIPIGVGHTVLVDGLDCSGMFSPLSDAQLRRQQRDQANDADSQMRYPSHGDITMIAGACCPVHALRRNALLTVHQKVLLMSRPDDLKTLFDGKHIQLQSRGTWEFAARKKVTGIVGIIAVTNDRKILLVEQYRPPVDAKVIELPAGLAGDVPGHATEDLAAAAKRELLEETGYHAEHWQMVCDGTTSAGITNEVITLFLATGLKKVSDQHGDVTESIVLHEAPLEGIDGWLADQRKAGKLIALKVYAGLYFAGMI